MCTCIHIFRLLTLLKSNLCTIINYFRKHKLETQIYSKSNKFEVSKCPLCIFGVNIIKIIIYFVVDKDAKQYIITPIFDLYCARTDVIGDKFAYLTSHVFPLSHFHSL